MKKHKMIRILVLEDKHLTNTGYWRIYRPLRVMSKVLFPGTFSIDVENKNFSYAQLAFYDVIITRRPSGESAEIWLKFLEKAKAMDVPIIFDEDDAVMMCPENHELSKVFERRDVRAAYQAALNTASLFWFSTPAFVESIPPLLSGGGAMAAVIPNAILPEDLPDGPAPDNGIIGWQGKSVQVHDTIEAGWDWYNENKHKAGTWLFFGWQPPLQHLANTQTIDYIQDVDVYVSSFKKNSINALWKPLIDCPFNDHKSNLNWLTATMGGGYCITNYAGKPGWEFATKEILPYDQACELWARSKEHILEHYNLLKTAEMRAQTIFSLVPQFFQQQVEPKMAKVEG